MKKNKNVSKSIKNGSLVITKDNYLYGSDGKSTKTRMTTVVDSNRSDELALVKYTKSSKNGRKFKNSKGFVGHGNTIYTLDNDNKPIKIDNDKFKLGNKKRSITKKQANEIKRRLIVENKYGTRFRKSLHNLKKKKGK